MTDRTISSWSEDEQLAALREARRQARKNRRTTLRASKRQIARALQLIFGSRSFVYQTYHKPADRSPLPPISRRASVTEKAVNELASLSDRGMDVGVVYNVMRGEGRKRENCRKIRYLFADCDSGEHTLDSLQQLAVPPTVIAETSPRRYHVAWRIEGCQVEQFQPLQRALAEKLGSDPSVSDPSRCLRLPGTVNRKHGRPFRTKLVHPAKGERRGPPTSIQSFVDAMGLAVPDVQATSPAGAVDKELLSSSQIRSLLKQINPDERDVWRKVGMALHSRYPGRKGRELWDDWSKGSEKFDAKVQQKEWARFRQDGGVTIGTLAQLAAERTTGAEGYLALTDDSDLANLIAIAGKGKIGFDPNTQSWWIFTGVVWERSPNAQGALQFAQQQVVEAARRADDPGLKKRLGRLTILKTAIGLAQLDHRLHLDEARFDQDPELLGVANGVIDLRRDVFRPATASDMLTRKAPIEHVEGAECPAFMQFVRDVCCERKDLIKYLIRLLGYFLTGHTREQQLYLLMGHAANGKGTLINLLAHILGRYVVPVAPALLARANVGNPNAPSPAVMRLQGARLITCTEMLPGKIDEAFVKQISGQDRIAGREGYGQQTEFLPEGKLLLSTNEDPQVSIAADAMWRRIVVIPFDATFMHELADHGLAEKLRAEASGILNLLTAAACAYLDGGLLKSDTVLAATARLRQRSDSIATWFRDYCRKGKARTQQSSKAYASYRRYSKAEGKLPLSQRVFNKSLTDMGFPVEHHRRYNRFIGFELRRV